MCQLKPKRRWRDESGQALLIVLGVASVVMILIMALMSFTRSEVQDARHTQAQHNLIWVGRSARNITEERFMKFLYGDLTEGIADRRMLDDWQLQLAISTNDPLKILEDALGLVRQEPGEMRFRVDLSDEDDGIVYDTLDAGAVLTNALDDDRQFDGVISLKPGGPAHLSDDQTMYVFPMRMDATIHSLTRTRATASNSGYSRETLQGNGSFTLFVRRSTFCDYLLFMEGASGVYLTKNDELDGPAHTNGSWNFMDNPGATILGRMSQSDEYAGFYANGSLHKAKADSYPPNEKNPKKITVKPTFTKGFYRGVPKISLPLDMSLFESAVLAGESAPPESTVGVKLPPAIADQDGVETLGPGGIYIGGDAAIELQQGDGTQTYVITQKKGYQTYVYTIVCDYSSPDRSQWNTTYTEVVQGTVKESKSYRGILAVSDHPSKKENAIYVNGKITALKGELDAETRLSICGNKDVTIDGDIRYEDRGKETANRLGILSEKGSVIVDYGSYPLEIVIDGAIMTPNGEFKLSANMCNAPIPGDGTRRKVSVFGGITSKKLGATEQGNGRGYGTNYHYDNRLRFDPPPLFPETGFFDVTLESPNGQDTLQWFWGSPFGND